MTHELEAPRNPTTVNVCRFASIMSSAVTMSAALAHLMELPAKMKYEPSLYVRLHRTLYPTFGRAAGTAEACAVATTGALVWLDRTRGRRAWPLTLAAAGCLAAAHGLFWTVVQPVNVEMMQWRLDAIPTSWRTQRNRWEYGHAVRAGLVTAALGALAWSLVSDAGDAANA